MSPLCLACGCSLVRLKITRADAASYVCCVEEFKKRPDELLAQLRR